VLWGRRGLLFHTLKRNDLLLFSRRLFPLAFVLGDKGGNKSVFYVERHKHGIGFYGQANKKKSLRLTLGCEELAEINIHFMKKGGGRIFSYRSIRVAFLS